MLFYALTPLCFLNCNMMDWKKGWNPALNICNWKLIGCLKYSDSRDELLSPMFSKLTLVEKNPCYNCLDIWKGRRERNTDMLSCLILLIHPLPQFLCREMIKTTPLQTMADGKK